MRERLGADEAIDYKTPRFAKEVRDVDVVFDAVGGESSSGRGVSSSQMDA